MKHLGGIRKGLGMWETTQRDIRIWAFESEEAGGG